MMKQALPYLIPFTVPLICIWGVETGGLYQFALYIYLAALVPALDAILIRFGVRRLTPAPQGLTWEQSGLFRVSLYAYGIAYWATIVWAVLRFSRTEGGFFDFILLSWFVGLVGSIAVTAAHELIHKRNTPDRWAGLLTMLGLSYMFFETEHIYGHHAKPATEGDPTSAQDGEGLYAFLARSTVGIVKTVFTIEKKRLARRGISFFNLRNESLWFLVLPVLCGFIFYWLAGVRGVLLFYGQGLMSYVFLEIVSYLQHYGLRRSKLANGQYEKLKREHSWHADFPISNYLAFEIHKHSDHHDDAKKPFYELSSETHGPQLPFGYPTMISLAFFPPLFRLTTKRALDKFSAAHT